MSERKSGGLTCPNCGARSLDETLDSRQRAGHVRRRKRCAACGERATTIEVVVGTDLRAGDVMTFEEADFFKWWDRSFHPDYPLALSTYP